MFTVLIDHNSTLPLYQQIYLYIRDEIRDGNLSCGMRLPSSRGLAADIAVSRNTVDMAYDQLRSEGYIEAKPQRGYYVCKIESNIQLQQQDEITIQKVANKEIAYDIDFSPNGVDMQHFPYNRWRKLMKETMIDDNSELFQSGDAQGDYELRHTIRTYLHQSRGVNCREEQIIIGAGSDYLLMLLSQLLKPNTKIGMENPTYKQAYYIFDSCGFLLYPISLDKDGIRVDELNQIEATISYVTPSHQFPLGTVMPIARRMQLLAWANEEGERYIIEDDYDSEFRYQGRPIPALQGSDTNQKVIYMGTFSKAIAPAIRIGYMVLPQKLLDEYYEKAGFYYSTVSRLDQDVIGRFIREGYFERHLNKMRGIYRSKHDCLLAQLQKLNIPVRITGESAGLHLLVEFPKNYIENELVETATKAGVRVYPLSNYKISETTMTPTIILGYARLSEQQIVEGINRLKQQWEGLK